MAEKTKMIKVRESLHWRAKEAAARARLSLKTFAEAAIMRHINAVKAGK